MSDNLSPLDRRKAMQAVKGKGTKPERQLWAMLAGMRVDGWSKNAADVIGKPDVVFYKEKIAIFVDGCFWHQCPECKRGIPQSNRAYWERKIARNVALAKQYGDELRQSGWDVIRIWEHELRTARQRKDVRERIREHLRRRKNHAKL